MLVNRLSLQLQFDMWSYLCIIIRKPKGVVENKKSCQGGRSRKKSLGMPASYIPEEDRSFLMFFISFFSARKHFKLSTFNLYFCHEK